MDAAMLNELKNLRKKLGLTQSELAKKAGVSQSLIAKIESNRIDPTFSKVQKIFDTLEKLEQETSIKAKDVMIAKIISVKPKDNLKVVIKKMREHEISQIPVIGSEVNGVVSESSILDKISEGKDLKDITVKDVMSDTPPIVSEDTDIKIITDLLKYNSLIIVSKFGKPKGVITRADLVRNLYKKP